ncbi:hypothetical protein CHUAL_009480 [Chamberlinius hualienensis]
MQQIHSSGCSYKEIRNTTQPQAHVDVNKQPNSLSRMLQAKSHLRPLTKMRKEIYSKLYLMALGSKMGLCQHLIYQLKPIY